MACRIPKNTAIGSHEPVQASSAVTLLLAARAHCQKPDGWHCLAIWDISAGPSLTIPPTKLPVSFPSSPANISLVCKALFISHAVIHFLPSLWCFSLAHSFFPPNQDTVPGLRKAPGITHILGHGESVSKVLGFMWREKSLFYRRKICSLNSRLEIWVGKKFCFSH